MTPGEDGVRFPAAGGRRSTSALGRAVLGAAAAAVDAEAGRRVADDAAWHRGYLDAARLLVELGLRDAASELTIARTGLEALHDGLRFGREGAEVALGHHAELGAGEGPAVAEVAGRGNGRPRLEVPVAGEVLSGDALRRRVDRWVADGVAEPSFGEALQRVCDHPEWLDLSDLTLVDVGAGAELGPLRCLATWGAHLVPVDLPGAARWQGILSAVREGRGRATVPLAGEGEDLAAAAGADVVADLPEVGAWLEALPGPLALTHHVYAHGAAHVLVSAAADALAARLLDRGDVALGFLATPTDVFAVPEAVVAAARQRWHERGAPRRAARSAARRLTGGRAFAPAYDGLRTTAEGASLGVADGSVAQQGPNYLLAKRLQRWRAEVARADGRLVSANVAPPTRTASVTANRVLAVAYRGAPAFGVEVFAPETARTLMAALLVHDLRNPVATGRPGGHLAHPALLLADQACHGGLWRQPYAPRSVLGLAVGRGLLPWRPRLRV